MNSHILVFLHFYPYDQLDDLDITRFILPYKHSIKVQFFPMTETIKISTYLMTKTLVILFALLQISCMKCSYFYHPEHISAEDDFFLFVLMTTPIEIIALSFLQLPPGLHDWIRVSVSHQCVARPTGSLMSFVLVRAAVARLRSAVFTEAPAPLPVIIGVERARKGYEFLMRMFAILSNRRQERGVFLAGRRDGNDGTRIEMSFDNAGREESRNRRAHACVVCCWE